MKRLILISVLVFLFVGCKCQFYGLNQNFGDSEFGSAGTMATVTAGVTVNVPYPATVNTNDFLILLVTSKQSTTFVTPSGWTSIASVDDADLSGQWWYKIADGTETGNLAVTIDDSGNSAGIMYQYVGTNTIDGVAGITSSAGTGFGNNPSAPQRGLGGAFLCLAADETVTATGSGYTEDDSQQTSDAGGFAFATASRPGTGGSVQVAFDWDPFEPLVLFSFMTLE
jgi:hypothetical protein